MQKILTRAAVDLAGYYPSAIRPSFTITIRDYYVNTYRDRFFIDPPLWFKGFILLELVYHVPLTCWAIFALLRGASTYIAALQPFWFLRWSSGPITAFGLCIRDCCHNTYLHARDAELGWIFYWGTSEALCLVCPISCPRLVRSQFIRGRVWLAAQRSWWALICSYGYEIAWFPKRRFNERGEDYTNFEITSTNTALMRSAWAISSDKTWFDLTSKKRES